MPRIDKVTGLHTTSTDDELGGPGPEPASHGRRAADMEQTPRVAEVWDTPPPAGASVAGETAPPSRVGRYLVLERLGAGGMGVVYSAYDPQLDRKVALKLLHSAADSDGLASRIQVRLLREARALAKLDDPHVVTVFDVGVVTGRIFIAMEYVPGKNLHQWLQQRRRSNDEIRAVFLAAGRGLTAAHSAGLIHRDFKLSNVMVRDDGAVRVLDFGLVQNIESTPTEITLRDLEHGLQRPRASSPSSTTNAYLTLTDAVLGTPAYMAPEQLAGGSATMASDQFSFCVALYQALYGTLPFHRQPPPSEPDLWHVTDPPDGSKVPTSQRQLLLRGLSFQPQDRYPSMQALLEGLTAVSRHRRQRWATLLVLVLALVVSSFFYNRARERQSQLCRGAEEKLTGIWNTGREASWTPAFVATGTPFAEDAAGTTRKILAGYSDGWVGMYTETCEATHRLGEQSAELLDRRMACLEQRRQELGALIEIFDHAQPETVIRSVEAARALSPVVDCADTAALLAPVALPSDSSTRNRVAEVRQRLAAAKARQAAGRYQQGIEIASEALTTAEAVGYWPATAEALLQLGLLQEEALEVTAAASTLERTLLAAEGGRHDRVATEAFIRLVRVAGFHQADFERGALYADLAATLLPHLGERRRLEADLADHLGLLRHRQGNLAEAVAHHQQALDLRQDTQEYPVAIARTLVRLGSSLKELGAFNDASSRLEQALALYQSTLGPSHPQVAATLDRLGGVALDVGDNATARRHYLRALDIYRRVFGDDHLRVADTLIHLGTVYLNLGENNQAMEHYRRVEKIYQLSYGEDHPNLAAALNNIGSALTEQQRPREALPYFERALSIQQTALGAEHFMVGYSLYNAGEAKNDLGEFADALEQHRQALLVWRRSLGEDHFLIAHGHLGEGRSLIGLGRYPEAESSLRNALDRWPSTGRDPVYTAETEFQLARALWATERQQAALALARSAHDVLAAATGKYRGELAEVKTWLDQRNVDTPPKEPINQQNSKAKHPNV